jgi:ribosomal protein L30/L7E
MEQIVFNSFPRSGNVYQGSMSRHFFKLNQVTVHIPEIFGVKGLYTVTIFRKPEDAISSLIMKENNHGDELAESTIYKESLNKVKYYKEYIDFAKINQETIYIGKFNNLISDG